MLEQVWRLQTDSITWQRVAESVLVFDLRNSTYLSIDGCGIVVWELLSRGARLDDLIRIVTETFDVNVDTAHSDLAAFLQDLARRGLACTTAA
jgi:Coenzyme PQQ synthesis protein D (PqqD)